MSDMDRMNQKYFLRIGELEMTRFIKCKKCGQRFEDSRGLEHIFLIHDDHEAGKLLSIMNALNGRGK